MTRISLDIIHRRGAMERSDMDKSERDMHNRGAAGGRDQRSRRERGAGLMGMDGKTHSLCINRAFRF